MTHTNGNKLGSCIAAALVAGLPALAAAQGSSIGYATVDEAMAALKGRKDVKMAVRDGWTLAEERAEGKTVFWWFTPKGHPAHPAAVRREIVKDAGSMRMGYGALCEAEKGVCEKLVAEVRKRRGDELR